MYIKRAWAATCAILFVPARSRNPLHAHSQAQISRVLTRGGAHPDRCAPGKAVAQGAQGTGRVPGPVAGRSARGNRAARSGKQDAVQAGYAREDRRPAAGLRPGSAGGGQSPAARALSNPPSVYCGHLAAAFPMSVIETGRLCLREMADGDAPFILEVLTDPDFVANVGDRGVHELAAARRYIVEGPGAS